MSQTMERTSVVGNRVQEWVSAFADALATRDVAAVRSMFAGECFWRDLVAFTWNITTCEGAEQIGDMLTEVLDRVDPRNFAVTTASESDGPGDMGPVDEAFLRFETAVGRGTAHLRLAGGKAWTLLTVLDELKGHEENQRDRRPFGTEHGANPQRVVWHEAREREDAELGYSQQPEVVIVGGGQGGIALGARLRQLGVPAIIVEANERAGDSWRRRYKSLALHDPVWVDHLPYIPFPDNWPVFTPKNKIGDWLEMYVRVMEIPYWGSTTATRAEFDGERWTVAVTRDGEDVELRPRHLVIALGVSGKPNLPSFPGEEHFGGEIQHSSQHQGPEGLEGKKLVVIGSNNSAHDISAAAWEQGVDVTMVQRSSTHIVRSDQFVEHAIGPLYSEEAVDRGIDVHTADLLFASQPYGIMHRWQKPVYDHIRMADAEFYSRLADAGFEVDFGEDESGLTMKYLRRGSGYYIDVGASELIANGSIPLRRGQVAEVTGSGVVLDDGTTLDADVIVYATGYQSMIGLAADLVGSDVADKVGRVWGLGSDTIKDPGPWEGEERNMWKPTRQENLWFQGGNLQQARFYSLQLALQLKARQEGIPTPVYGLAEVHHQA